MLYSGNLPMYVYYSKLHVIYHKLKFLLYE